MYKHIGSVLVRTPLQSLDKANEPATLQSPSFEEGLYLSSPDLWHELQNSNSKKKGKSDLSLKKYWLRSCMRCTPFATFAGSMLVKEGEQTTIVIGSAHRMAVRVDMNFLSEIISDIARYPEIQRKIKFFTNNSIYEVPGYYRYAEYYLADQERKYMLSAVEKTPYLETVFNAAKNGATLEMLVALIRQQLSVSLNECTQFFNTLIDNQLLISELEPLVTGADPLAHLVDQLTSIPEAAPIKNALAEVRDLIAQHRTGIEYYRRIEEKLKSVIDRKTLPKNTLQVDMYLSAEHPAISKQLLEKIISQVNVLTALSQRNVNNDLEQFKGKYYERYEEKEMPLLTVLDTDMGIGYAGLHDATGKDDLVGDLYINNAATPNFSFDRVQQFIFSRYTDCITSNKRYIEITDDDLRLLTSKDDLGELPDSAFVCGNLMKQNGRIDEHNFLFNLQGAGGPSGGNLLGRFTHGDEAISTLTKEIIGHEETMNPEAVYAEIVHLPEARTGNILLRPVLRQYEIPYVGLSGAPVEFQLTADDLMVSIRDSKIRLRSRRLNKEIIPRLTTAHNYTTHSLIFYKFLCDLQTQDIRHFGIWDWGIVSFARFLPRVVYKNIIIKKARWLIEEKDLGNLSVENWQAKIEAFLEKFKLPKQTVYAEGDNELLLDLATETGIDLLVHYLKRYKTIFLEEFLFTGDNCVVRDVNDNPYANEMVIPLQKLQSSKATPFKIIKPDKRDKRKFQPGSEWLYLKLYCGALSTENLFTQTLYPFIEQGVQDGWFEKFFFIRYRDEFPHLRIRFYNADAEKQVNLQRYLMGSLEWASRKGMIHKVSIDTYIRELERYKLLPIQLTESLFFQDSLAILRDRCNRHADPSSPNIALCMKAIDLLADDFGYDLDNKIILFKKLQAVFFKEFGAAPHLQKQLNEKYRLYQKQIFSMFGIREQKDDNSLLEPYKQRSVANGIILKDVQLHQQGGIFSDSLHDFVASHIHMLCNRYFIGQQRKYELLVYHFLDKFYTSQAAIIKGKATDHVAVH